MTKIISEYSVCNFISAVQEPLEKTIGSVLRKKTFCTIQRDKELKDAEDARKKFEKDYKRNSNWLDDIE